MRSIRQFERSGGIIAENLNQFMEQHDSSIYALPAPDGIVLSTAQMLPGCCIAGGAALAMFTGEINKIKDWDLFFTSKQALLEAQETFEGKGFRRMEGGSTLARTYTKYPVVVQLVKRRYYSTIDEIFADFDLSVCCVAICGQDICYTCISAKHIKSRKYDLVRAEDASLCLQRVARYGEKGFFPSEAFISDFLEAVLDGMPLRKDYY